MTGLPAQVYNRPMPFTLLQVSESPFRELVATPTGIWRLQMCLPLFDDQPVAQSDPWLLDALDTPSPGRQVGAEETGLTIPWPFALALVPTCTSPLRIPICSHPRWSIAPAC